MRIDEIVTSAARRRPAEIALHWGEASWSFSELDTRVDALADWLTERTDPGDRVALLGHNTADYVTALYAVSRAGCITVPVNQRLHPAEWRSVIERTEPHVLIGAADELGALDPMQASVEVVPFDDVGELRGDEPGAGGPQVADTDPAWIIFTSGTTGRPKGAVLTHRSMLAAVHNSAIGRPVAADDVYVFPFPLCHVAAYNVLLQHFHARPVVLLERFEPEAVMAATERHRATTMSLAPTMIAALLDDPAFDPARLETLRSIGYGASAIPVEVLKQGLAQLGCEFAQGYGMTELSGNAVFLHAEHHRRAASDEPHLLTSAGLPGPLVSVRIAADGEIEVCGDQVTAGYWNDAEATAAAFTDDGWFRTGDIGRIDADGLLSVVDRKKDLVVTGGENVSSREVEDALHEHPAVAEVAVIGTPDDRWGEVVTAVVVVRDGRDVSADDLIEHCRTRLASYKKPRLVRFVDELPKNASGKMLKRELR